MFLLLHIDSLEPPSLGYTYDTQGMDLETFENLFRESYFNPHHRWSIANEFESLYQGDMAMTEDYNRFIEQAQYYMARNIDAVTLISKFMRRLRQLIADKIDKHWFNTLMDYYAFAQLAEANIESWNIERARARNLRSSKKMTKRGSGG